MSHTHTGYSVSHVHPRGEVPHDHLGGTDLVAERQMLDGETGLRTRLSALQGQLADFATALERANAGRESQEWTIREQRQALEFADGVLARIEAPCPQCHTLGDDPKCGTLSHALPQEAREDIHRARQGIQNALNPGFETGNGRLTSDE